MRNFTSIILFVLILISGCHDQTTAPQSGAGGSLRLSFAQAPPGITQVIARARRSGFEDRVLALPISDSGNAASGIMSDMPIGTWHLKVDAEDSAGHVRFSGETDVDVLPGQMTAVRLELSPTSGSIEIYVTWGASCTPSSQDLASWWRGEFDGSDAVGGNNGVLLNGVTFAPGKVGRAFQFNGYNSYIRVPNSPGLNATGSFSIEGWIYPTQDKRAMIISKWGFSYGWENQREWSLNLWPGRNLNFGIADAATQEDSAFQAFATHGGVLTLNAWNHVAAVYDKPSGTRRLYVDGAKVAERTDPPIDITQSIADVSIGAYQYSPGGVWDYFAGRIDEISFYQGALTDDQVHAIYGAGSIGKCIPPPPPQECTPAPPGLVSWWRGDGTTADAIGSNNGTLVGAATFGPGKVGQAFSLNGSDGFVLIPNSSTLNVSGSFTLDAWIFPKEDKWATIVSKWGDSYHRPNQRSYNLEMSPGGGIGFAISDSAHQNDPDFIVFRSEAGLLTLNHWNHVAGVYDRTTGIRRIYVNGVKVAERVDSAVTVFESIADVAIGASFRSETVTYETLFPGLIDEVDLFQRALTGTEIQRIYLAGNGGKCR